MGTRQSLDTFCPIGPRVASPDEVGDPQSLRIVCRLNGQPVQDATTVDMIFSVAELVSYITKTIALEPGDVIASGTPRGVAMGHAQPRYLQPGDTVEVEVEHIGTLTKPRRRRPGVSSSHRLRRGHSLAALGFTDGCGLARVRNQVLRAFGFAGPDLFLESGNRPPLKQDGGRRQLVAADDEHALYHAGVVAIGGDRLRRFASS
jgi:hypothetical protein